MKITRDGVVIRVPDIEGSPRVTLTLPAPYDGASIRVEATKYAIDIDPMGISLELGDTAWCEAHLAWGIKRSLPDETPTADMNTVQEDVL